MTATPYEILPVTEAWKTLARDIWTSLKALRRGRVRRDRRQVDADYHSGVWRSTLERKPWRSCRDLREYVVSADENVTVAKIDGRLVRVRSCDYYAYRAETVQAVLKRYAGAEPELIELGCGCGQNLFTLVLANHWKRLAGFDVSENAVQAAREAAEHFGVAAISFGRLDLTRGNDPAFESLRGRTVFTYYCLEQLKYSTAQVIDNLLRAGPRRVIHIEPSHELLRLFSLMDWATRLYVTRNDYQNNLLTTLRRFEKAGVLRIVGAERLYYAPTSRNDPTLICWEPNANPEGSQTRPRA